MGDVLTGRWVSFDAVELSAFSVFRFMRVCNSGGEVFAAWVQVRRYEAHVLYAPIPLRTCLTGVPMRENLPA